MKRFAFVAFVALSMALVGCSKDKIDTLAKVSVHVNDFSIEQEDIPGVKGAVADYDGVKAITLAFYTADGTEQYKTTQLRSDATTYTTFGEFDLSLPMGNYTMVVLGYGKSEDDDLVLTSPTQAEYTGAHARETFAAVQTVNIASASAVNLSATLNRIIAKLQVVSTDGRTANAANVRMTMSAGGRAFNPTTGLATIDTGFVNTVGISASAGSTSSSISYLFLATDEQTMDITLDVLDADGNSISHHEVSDVPFKRNRVTRLTGSLYSTDASSTFQLNTAWLSDTTITF